MYSAEGSISLIIASLEKQTEVKLKIDGQISIL
jgi:hypothetical protein